MIQFTWHSSLREPSSPTATRTVEARQRNLQRAHPQSTRMPLLASGSLCDRPGWRCGRRLCLGNTGEVGDECVPSTTVYRVVLVRRTVDERAEHKRRVGPVHKHPPRSPAVDGAAHTVKGSLSLGVAIAEAEPRRRWRQHKVEGARVPVRKLTQEGQRLVAPSTASLWEKTTPTPGRVCR